MQITTKSAAISKMNQALEIAIKSGNKKLEKTLRDMLQNCKAQSCAAHGIELQQPAKHVRTAYNLKRAAVKLKTELYDTRIELESKEEIAQRRADYQQKCRVFACH